MKLHEIRLENLPLIEQELLEMANVDYETTGIPKVVLWVGPHPGQHWMRIKVSNTPDKYSPSDNFVITIPEFRIIGNVNEKFITQDILDSIKYWIRLNFKAIKQYSNYKLSTKRFLDLLKPV